MAKGKVRPGGNGTMTGSPEVEMKLEAVVIPVTDIDRAKAFYAGLGWRLDADFGDGKTFRGVQLTPPGSQCSVIFGKGVTSAAPGSAQGLFLVVANIEAARAELIERGVKVSEPFHRADGELVKGLDPERRSYTTYASFSDPDGNGWLLQEITQRLPGRVAAPAFASASDLAKALRRAETAHGKYEATLGSRDQDWPRWYAEYLVREQAGEGLPQ